VTADIWWSGHHQFDIGLSAIGRFPGIGQMLRLLRLAGCLLLLLLPYSVAHAEKRVALVIGNGSYKASGFLRTSTMPASSKVHSLKRIFKL